MNHARSHLSRLRAFLVAGLLAVVSLTGHAAKWDRSTDYTWATTGANTLRAFPTPGAAGANLSGWAQGTMTPAATGPTWTSNGKALPFNPSPTANFKARFTPASMAKALLNPMNAIPLLAAPILSQLFSQACVRLAGGSMQLADGAQWEECVMGNVTVTVWCYGNSSQCPQIVNNTPTGRWTEFPERMKQDMETDNPLPAGYSRQNWSFVASQARWRFDIYQGGTLVQSGASFYGQSASITQQQASGNYAGTTEAAVEADLTAALSSWSQADFLYGFDSSTGKPSGGTKDVVEAIINSGNSLEAEIVAPTIQTPINEAPVTTTTTNPDGSKKVETEVTTNDYSCLVIEDGKAVECKQAKTTTKTTATTSNPNGTGTVTTTATTVLTKTNEAPTKGHCELYPDTVGCSKFGTGDAGPAITKDTKAVTIGTVSFSGGSCPAPVAFSAFGRSYAFEYSPLCERLASLAPLFLALSALLAAWIFADGFRVT